jgi:alpha-amylase
MNPVSLVLILHAHQPVGNFDHVIEQSYRRSYLPFLDCLERHPAISINLHFSGSLLEWIEMRHPDYLTRIRKLREAGRVEILGGGFYEPILAVIPEADRQAQIARLHDYVRKVFGEPPNGLWLAERVWEPALPESLAKASVKYTLVDDTHFLSAGIEPDALYGYYSTESDGHRVAVIPGLKSLRYLIPWRPVDEVLATIRRVAESQPNALLAMGDDLEKFGSWPQTYRTVYEQHWLDDLFAALEANLSWVRCARASEYLDSHAALGRVYLPTASYREMTEWWLPPRAAEIYTETVNRLQAMEGGERYLRFVNAGSWRNFLAKYSESNLLHKEMLAVSRRLHGLKAAPAALKKAAHRHLLAAQCNDAYWHGVFGGLYAPHLRHSLYSHLIQADTAIDKLAKTFEEQPVHSQHFDLTLNGRPELEVRSERVNFLIRPSDGATVASIHYKPAAANLVNSLRRRPEVYHKKVAQASIGEAAGESKSIHDRVVAKHEGLGRYLLYDRYDRNAFRNYLFPPGKTFEDFCTLQLEEPSEWAKGDYALAEKGKSEWLFVRSGPLSSSSGNIQLLVEKQFRLEPQAGHDRLICLLGIKCFQGSGRFRLGLEVILNLLAGDAPDRYFSTPGWKQNLEWRGELPGSNALSLTDEWLKVSLDLAPDPLPAFWWLCPIFSVSQSEDGFEKVYQGSSIMPVWELDLKTSSSWECSVALGLRPLV